MQGAAWRWRGGKVMPDWVWFLVIFAGYIVLMRWVLPALGVPT